MFHLKLNISRKPIVYKYREGKMKSSLERELKAPEIGKEEGYGFAYCAPCNIKLMLSAVSGGSYYPS
jgi:hypothetical protein